MSFTTPLLGYNRGPGAQHLGIGGYFDTFDPFNFLSNPFLSRSRTWSPQEYAQQITAGEEVGYIEYDPLPLPTLGEGLPYFWPRWSLPDKSAIPQDPVVPVLVDEDTPEFPEGSIFAPGEIWSSPIPEEIYNAPYEVIDPAEPVPELEAPPTEGETEVAIDWGDFISTAAQTYIQTALAPTPFVPSTPAATPGPNPMGYSGSCPPRKTRTLTIDCATGQEVKRTRRRRRRLLTESDFNDLMRIATLPNKQNVAVALSKAVGR